MTLSQGTVGLYAETLVRQAAASGVVLDYSEASLGTLDGLLSGSDSQYTHASATQRDLVIFYAGCYLGEVVVRVLQGHWIIDDPWAQSRVLIAQEPGGVEIRPFEKLQRRLTEGGDGNHLTAYLQGIRELLTGIPL
jgi:hypothetical protein